MGSSETTKSGEASTRQPGELSQSAAPPIPTRTLKYHLVNNAFCVAQVPGQPFWCVRFFRTGAKEYTALFANGEMYKRFTVESSALLVAYQGRSSCRQHVTGIRCRVGE